MPDSPPCSSLDTVASEHCHTPPFRHLPQEVVMAINSEIVEKVPYFHDQDPLFVVKLIMELEPEMWV